MKYTTLLFVLTFPIFLFGQRGDVPTSNPDNALDLKVVFQEYTIITSNQYGSSSQESEYLNLKVNNLYMPEGITGINKKHFKKYLANCPKALDQSLDGLSIYGKESRSYTYGALSMYGGMGAGAYIFYQGRNNITQNTVIAGLSAALGGMALNYLFNKRGQRLKRKADDKIVNAFDMYAKNCYKPELNTSTIIPGQDEKSIPDNGDNNNDEQVLIELLTNNASSKFISLSGFAGFRHTDASAIDYGAELNIYKKGIYLNAQGYYANTLGDKIASIEDRELGYSARLSIPFFGRKSILKKAMLDLGKMQGLNTVAKSNDLPIETYKSFGLDVGIDHYRQNLDKFGIAEVDYFVTATMLRGGLSRTWFSNISYKINDNRFSESTRYKVSLVKLYVDAVYNYENEYQIIPNGFGTNPILEDELGYAFGADLRMGYVGPFTAVNVNMEAGKLPLLNGIDGWAFRFRLGFGLYTVDR